MQNNSNNEKLYSVYKLKNKKDNNIGKIIISNGVLNTTIKNEYLNEIKSVMHSKEIHATIKGNEVAELLSKVAKYFNKEYVANHEWNLSVISTMTGEFKGYYNNKPDFEACGASGGYKQFLNDILKDLGKIGISQPDINRMLEYRKDPEKLAQMSFLRIEPDTNTNLSISNNVLDKIDQEEVVQNYTYKQLGYTDEEALEEQKLQEQREIEEKAEAKVTEARSKFVDNYDVKINEVASKLDSKLNGKKLIYGDNVNTFTLINGKLYGPYGNVENGKEMVFEALDSFKELIDYARANPGVKADPKFKENLNKMLQTLTNRGIAPLHLNRIGKDANYDYRKDINDIYEKVDFYNNNPDKLYELSADLKGEEPEIFDNIDKENLSKNFEKLKNYYDVREIFDDKTKETINSYYANARNPLMDSDGRMIYLNLGAEIISNMNKQIANYMEIDNVENYSKMVVDFKAIKDNIKIKKEEQKKLNAEEGIEVKKVEPIKEPVKVSNREIEDFNRVQNRNRDQENNEQNKSEEELNEDKRTKLEKLETAFNFAYKKLVKDVPENSKLDYGKYPFTLLEDNTLYAPYSNIENGKNIAVNAIKAYALLNSFKDQIDSFEKEDYQEFVKKAKQQILDFGIREYDLIRVEKNPDFDVDKDFDEKYDRINFYNSNQNEIYEISKGIIKLGEEKVDNVTDIDVTTINPEEKDSFIKNCERLAKIYKIRDILDIKNKMAIESKFNTLRNPMMDLDGRVSMGRLLPKDLLISLNKDIASKLKIEVEESKLFNADMEVFDFDNIDKYIKEHSKEIERAKFENNLKTLQADSPNVEKDPFKNAKQREPLTKEFLDGKVNENKWALLDSYKENYNRLFKDENQSITKENLAGLIDIYHELKKVHEARPKPWFFQFYSKIRISYENQFIKTMEDKLKTKLTDKEMSLIDTVDSDFLAKKSSKYYQLDNEIERTESMDEMEISKDLFGIEDSKEVEKLAKDKIEANIRIDRNANLAAQEDYEMNGSYDDEDLEEEKVVEKPEFKKTVFKTNEEVDQGLVEFDDEIEVDEDELDKALINKETSLADRLKIDTAAEIKNSVTSSKVEQKEIDDPNVNVNLNNNK